jgi:aerobic-type carbon monoxide dehydrogenase small subunit (CoxS/CutS family)/carbon monoxide dehydrogenase subunit G
MTAPSQTTASPITPSPKTFRSTPVSPTSSTPTLTSPTLASPATPSPAPVSLTPVALTVNGRAVQALVEPRTHLADFLREHLHLTGTHLGCEQGVCGACTILLDGKPQRSCIAYALDCDASTVTTIEGFDDDPLMADLRTAFSAHHGLQCGFCTPGMLVTARDIVARLGDVPEARIREELSGNLCRCTGYVGIVAAIRAVCAGRQPVAGPIVPARPGLVSARASVVSAPIARESAPSGTATAPQAAAQLSPPPIAAAPGGPMLTEQVTLAAAPDAVWAALADVRAVALCLPGAEITSLDGEQLTGLLRVALGPITAGFTGQGSVSRDDASRTGRLSGRGRDRGTGSAVEGEARYAVRPANGGTALEVQLSWRLTGSLAQFARTDLVQAVARRLLQSFTSNLESLLAGNAPAAPRPLGMFGLLWALIRARLFGR